MLARGGRVGCTSQSRPTAAATATAADTKKAKASRTAKVKKKVGDGAWSLHPNSKSKDTGKQVRPPPAAAARWHTVRRGRRPGCARAKIVVAGFLVA